MIKNNITLILLWSQDERHPLAGLVDALGSQFAKLGEGLKRAGNTIGNFLVDMGYKLHSIMCGLLYLYLLFAASLRVPFAWQADHIMATNQVKVDADTGFRASDLQERECSYCIHIVPLTGSPFCGSGDMLALSP